MTRALISVKIRLQGTKDQIDEALRRLACVFDISFISRLYDERSDPNGSVKLCYLRVYQDDTHTMFDQVQASQRDLNELALENIELLQENHRLKEQLALLPKPRPDAAVLGTPHRERK